MAAISAPLSRRALQAAVVLGSLSPIYFGLAGIVLGPGMVAGEDTVLPVDLDSHWRFLSGIFFCLGLAFLSTVPDIERQGARFRLAGTAIMVGGGARLISLFAIGTPSAPHLAGLGAELVLMPLLMAWQASVARRAKKG